MTNLDRDRERSMRLWVDMGLKEIETMVGFQGGNGGSFTIPKIDGGMDCEQSGSMMNMSVERWLRVR